MAENLLNAAWVLISIGVFVNLARSQRSVQSSIVQALIALSCVAILLFPAVSATDDLLTVQFPAEDCSRVVKKFKSASSCVLDVDTPATTAAFFDIEPGWSFVPLLDTAAALDARAVVTSPVASRAPPA